MGSEREQDLARTATAPGTASAPGPAEPVGATLGRYRLERELGAGAMGVVHAAFDPDLERRIALKVLRGSTATIEAKDRLMREARAMARLAHPNVVTVHEVGTAGGRDFIAMELIHGESLAEWMRATRRPAAGILDAFAAAGRGLAAAHAAGVVHRDFKPHNVLRSRDGRIVVTDFGLAREAETALPPALDATLPIGTMTAPRSAGGSGAASSTGSGGAAGRAAVGTGAGSAGSTAASTSTSSTPSSLAGLTVTGSLLGTPAYMAPEQWMGGAVTPATDQFSFCVALWEALSGERPYRGPTFDDLRNQVARGPAALDASRIPRRLRSILRRGLDPDPARRWPDMDALLGRLMRAKRRPGVALAIAGAAIAAAVALVVLRPAAVPAPDCEPSARDIDAVWSPAERAELAGKATPAHVAAFDLAYWDWRAARNAACQAPPAVRLAQLQCLKDDLGRIHALRAAFVRAPDVPAEEITAQMIDPAICRKPAAAEIPRLTLTASDDVVAALAAFGRAHADTKPSDAELTKLVAASSDPCAKVIASLAFDTASTDVPRARSLLSDAIGAADQCGDERLRADLLIRESRFHWELPVIGPKGAAAMRNARIAAAHVLQPDLAATIAGYAVAMARSTSHVDEAFRLIEDQVAGYRVRGMARHMLGAVIWRNTLWLARSTPDDLAAVQREVAAARPLASAIGATELIRQLDITDAYARLRLGHVAAAHDDLVKLWQRQPPAPGRHRPGRRVTGQVVDTAGRPVAGATVAASGMLDTDSISVGVPALLGEDPDLRDDMLRVTTSDAAGQFTLDDAVGDGAVIAQLGDQRSPAAPIADRVRLALRPTRSVSGKVELGGVPYTELSIHATPGDDPTGRLYELAPVAADGSFTVAGASTGKMLIAVTQRSASYTPASIDFQSVPASPAPVVGLTVRLPSSNRTIDVVMRSAIATPLEGGQVVLLAGHPAIGNLGDLIRIQVAGIQVRTARPVAGENAPQAVLDKVHAGDLFAHVEHARAGDLTVCGLALTGDLMDPDYMRTLQSHLSQLAVKCEFIGPTTSVVTLAVPPQQRFDER